MPKPLKHVLVQFTVMGFELITIPTDLVRIAFAFGVIGYLHGSLWPISNDVHWERPIIDRKWSGTINGTVSNMDLTLQ